LVNKGLQGSTNGFLMSHRAQPRSPSRSYVNAD